MKANLPILLLLLLSACVPEPLVTTCETSCGEGDAVTCPCDTCDAEDCRPCEDVAPQPIDTCAPYDVVDPDVPDVPDCPGEAPVCPDQGVCADLEGPLCLGGEWACPLWELAAWEPVEVTCDDLDNDCDGDTDGALTPPAGTCKLQGVCAGSVLPVCTDAGTWDCGYDQVVLYEAVEVSFCDGQDNDCDGLTDAEEGTPCQCNPGARICKPGDPASAQFCLATGAGWEDEPCLGGTVCMGMGECTGTGVFQVNETVVDDQAEASVIRADSGQWVVVWRTQIQDGSMGGIGYRKLNLNGELFVSESLANSYTILDQVSPTITPLPDGRSLIAWESVDQFGAHTSVVSRVFPGVGPSPYGEILLSADLGVDATGPAAATAGPAAVIAWEGGDSGDRDVLLRFVEGATGLPMAGQINLSAGSPGQDRDPVVVSAGDGFAVLWEKGAPLTEVYGRIVGADGTPGPILEVFSKGGDATEDIAAAGTADHVLVLWTEVGGQAVSGRVYNADLTAITPPAPTTTLPVAAPLVGAYAAAPDGWGGFVVAWQDDQADPPAIRLRRWDPDDGLAPVEDEVVVATSDETPLTVTPHLSVAGSPGGKVLVLWNAAAPGGNGTSEVFGRFVSIPAPE
ncbi:MAG: hypothetical protein ABIK09_05055 [Pseudomonadota bacterium]